MSNLIPGNQKHLTLNDRLYIEHALDDGRSFRDIAKYLCKDPTTISREVRLHRSLDTWHKCSFNNPYNFCIHRFKCRKTNVCNKLLICDQKCASCHKCNQVCDRFVSSRGLAPPVSSNAYFLHNFFHPSYHLSTYYLRLYLYI